jgi:D-arabinose 5-phosphate isomerase GutQ
MSLAGRDPLSEAKALVGAEAAALAALPAMLDDEFLALAELVHRCAGRVVVTGAGTSGAVAHRLAHLLSVTGTAAYFLHPGDAVHGGVGTVTPDDILLAISKGGYSDEVNVTAERAAGRGARVIVLTARPVSPLAALAHRLVVLPDASAADPGGIIAMGSTLVAAAYGDALALAVMRLRGYGWDRVRHSHPAGAVGKLGEPR